MEKEKIYYTMGEVAEMFDVRLSLIRFWDKEFSILKPDRNKKGNRLFRPKDLETFRLIYFLIKEKGMTIEGAKQYLAKSKLEPIEKDITVVERLENIKSLLSEVLLHIKEEDKNLQVMYEEE